MPLDKFGTMTQETETEQIGPIAIALGSTGRVILNWIGQPGVKLQQVNLATGAVIDVPGRKGKARLTLQPIRQTASINSLSRKLF